jgi:nitroreductase
MLAYLKRGWRILQLLGMTVTAYVHFTKETASALRYKIFEQRDDDALKMRTGKLGHLVEKYILIKTNNYEEQKKVYDELSECIEELYRRGYEPKILPVLNWAQNIRWEYQNYSAEAKECKMTGKLIRNKDSPAGTLGEIIRQRRSVRKFTDEIPDINKIERLIDAAKCAPTACNQQGLKYIVIYDTDTKKKVAETISGGKQFAHTAPVILIVVADKRGYRLSEERFTPYQDAAAAIQNILLTAEFLGFGACWCTYTSYSSISEESGIRKLLNIPDWRLICGAVAIGYPSQTVCPVTRDRTDALYFVDRME